MTAPLTGPQKARLRDLAERCDITGLETKAADLRHALDLIDANDREVSRLKDFWQRRADHLRVLLDRDRDILADLIEIHGGCWLDHNGTCQGHFLEPGELCVIKRARSALGDRDDEADTGRHAPDPTGGGA